MQSLYNALTPPALVLAGLRCAVARDVPGLSFVFDPSLDWGEAARARRAQRAMQAGSAEEPADPDGAAGPGDDPSQYPLMAWNRSTLVPMEGRGRRNAWGAGARVRLPGAGDEPGEEWAVQAFFGQLTFAFKLFSRDMLELEALETGYVARSLVSDVTGFDIPIEALYPGADGSGVPPELCHYDVVWNPLDPELDVEKAPAATFGVRGSATVRGAFLTGVRQSLYPLNAIRLGVRDMERRLMEEVVVHRGG